MLSAVVCVASSAAPWCVTTHIAMLSAVVCVASSAVPWCVAAHIAMLSAVVCVASSAVPWCVATHIAMLSAMVCVASSAVLWCVATHIAMLSAVVCVASNAVRFTVRYVAVSKAAYLSEPFPVYSSSLSTNKVRSRQDNFLCQPSALPSSSNAGTHIHVSMFLITPLSLQSLSTVRSIQI